MELSLQFLTWEFILFSLFVSGVTYILRKIADFYFKNKFLDFWNEVFLPVFPFFLGGFMGYFVSMYPYPEDLNTSFSRSVWGSVAGLLSTVVFRAVKSLLGLKDNSDLLDSIKDSINKDQ